MNSQTLTRILYVEDDDDIREIGQIALQVVGNFEVLACASGAQAIAAAVDFAPQLLLLDVMMPNLDGPATLEQLRKLAPLANTPVVFMTAKTQAHEVAAYKALGAIEVIAKPFDAIQLPQHIQSVWEQAQGSAR
ncbi:MAG: response regulator [Aeromonadales bacterium]|nr:response regulator [Aeromonadales bacterium]